MKKLLSFAPLLLGLFILSCKKIITEIKDVPTPIIHSWLSDSSLFGSQKIILSASKIDDTTLAIFNKQNAVYINANQLNGSTTGTFLPGGYYGNSIPPSLSNMFGVYPIDSNHLSIFAIRSPTSNYGGIMFSPQYSNSSTSIKGFPLADLGSGYSIINNKFILAPFEIDYTTKSARCSLIQIDTIGGISNSVLLISAKDVSLICPSSTNGFFGGGYFAFSFYNKFFLNLSSQFFSVDTLGNVKAFGYSPVSSQNQAVTQMFTIDNYLFAQTYSQFLISSDFGETWTIFVSLQSTSPYLLLTYINVDNELYAYFESQIWRVTISGQSMNYVELDNDGLKTNQITGINKVGKYAFVSTLSGLYYRDTTTLNTPK